MYYITVDCGTTNSRAYIVDENAKLIAKAKKKVGVKDTAQTGSKDTLRNGLKEIIEQVVKDANLDFSDIKAILSSGMITSEIGLYEIPHLVAPAGVAELCDSITKVENAGIAPDNIPVYFVRGIKNAIPEIENPYNAVGYCDFMRGEETQVAGLLEGDISLPNIVVVLSSHTKLIPINEEGKVTGSLTTMNGQFYEAIAGYTFVGKSIQQRDNAENAPEDYFDESIIDEAMYWVKKVGIMRALMFPRFMDVLLDTTWYGRELFFNAMLAAEDMLCMNQLEQICDSAANSFLLVGLPQRCRLYQYVLQNMFKDAKIECVSDVEQVDLLSIKGVVSIAKRAGL